MDKVKPVYDFVYKIVMLFCKLLLVAEIIITSIVVGGRFIIIKSPAWGEEMILTCMVYMAMLSATMALRKSAHIRMTALDDYLPKKVVNVLDLLADVAVFIFAVIMIKEGFIYSLGIGSKGTYTSLPGLSKFWLYFPVPLAGIVMVFFEIEAMFKHLKVFFVKTVKEGEVQ
jgi:TRAP-type C4-dicarboxylate transport system permease small subunit